MKNRNIALLLAAGMLLGLLTGCGSETASAVSAPSAEVTEASEATETPAEPVSAEESAASKADQVASAGEMTMVEEVVEEGMTPVSPSELKDGTYEGTALGFGDDITVQITISGGQMTDITVLQHDGEDKPYYTQALTMLDKMLTAQTGDVDIVSGATLTCEGLRDAVQDALGKAAA